MATNLPDKSEIERKVNENSDLTETEKEAVKARLFEMAAVVTKHSIDSTDRKNLLKKSWQLMCVTSITLNKTSEAIDMYIKLEDDGTRLREIINDAYKQFTFMTPIDTVLNFINALPKTHLKVSGVYALLAAMTEKEHLDNIKMLRVTEFVDEDIIPSLTEAETKQNHLYQKLPEKMSKYVEDTLNTCAKKILEEKYGEIIFYARECPTNFEKHLGKILKRCYNRENFKKVLNFVNALPTEDQKIVGMNEIYKLKAFHEIEEKAQKLRNSSHLMNK